MHFAKGQTTSTANRAALERAIAETDGILRTFATLMEIARAESGKAGIAMAPVDLGGIVGDMVELYAPLAEEKGLAIEATLDETEPVAGHAQFLSQLVANLLDNALAYTPEGRIRVRPRAARRGRGAAYGGGFGAGDPPEERERVLHASSASMGAAPAAAAGSGSASSRASPPCTGPHWRWTRVRWAAFA